MEEGGNPGGKALMLDGVVREEGLSREPLQEPSQAALQGAFARQAIFMRLRAAQFGEQLHFDPLEADAQVKEKACRNPTQGH
jgi:hypothetical protein